MVDRAEKRCDEMKQKLFEVKEDMKEKATEIITEFKKKGKEACAFRKPITIHIVS